ncbi:coiled-coil domain-containing protein [archaeon]|nr:MAG: coiled-coil domain-containing protein [archaeon]
MMDESTRADAQTEDLRQRVEDKQAKCEQIVTAFTAFKSEMAGSAVNSHTGRPIPHVTLARFITVERDKDEEVARVQLKHIHLQSQVTKLEEALKKREQVADGLAMIDFEQLKIENSTLNEKIEDRNDEIAKLRKKATVAVQALTHVREKLHFVSGEASRLSSEVTGVDMEVAEQRSMLAVSKKTRERIRVENDRARHAQGFVNVDRLAIDFERRKRDVMGMREAIHDMKARYAALADFAGMRATTKPVSTPGLARLTSTAAVAKR